MPDLNGIIVVSRKGIQEIKRFRFTLNDTILTCVLQRFDNIFTEFEIIGSSMTIRTIVAHLARSLHEWLIYIILTAFLAVIAFAILVQLGRNVTEFSGFISYFYRGSHATVKLKDDTVLVIGGGFIPELSNVESIGGRSECFLFNPASKTWTQMASMSRARQGHTATLLPDGRVLVAGGTSDSSCEIYDPKKDQWTPTAPLLQPRSRHTASLLPDGRVLVAGGLTQSDSSPIPSCEIYDPVSAHWTAAASLPFPCYGHSCIELNDHRVLIVGGLPTQTFDLIGKPQPPPHNQTYDPKTNLWKQGKAFPDYCGYSVSLEALPDKTVLVDYNSSDNTPSHAIYDPEKDQWSRPAAGSSHLQDFISKHDVEPNYFTCTPLNDGRILIVDGDAAAQQHGGGGGSLLGKMGDGGGNLSKVILYNPTTHETEAVGCFPWSYPERKPHLAADPSIPIFHTEPSLEPLPASTDHNIQATLSLENDHIVVKLKNIGPETLKIVSHLRYCDDHGVYAIERHEADFQLFYGTSSLLGYPHWQPLNIYSPNAKYPNALEELFPDQTRQYGYNPDSYTVAWGSFPEKNSSMCYAALKATFHGDRPHIHKNLRARVLIRDKDGRIWPVWSNSISLTDKQLNQWVSTVASVGYEN